MTVPGAVEVIAALVRDASRTDRGRGHGLGYGNARRCLDAGAKFLTSTGLDLEVVEFAHEREHRGFSGRIDAQEVMAAWKAGADFVKIFPCAQVGGAATSSA